MIYVINKYDWREDIERVFSDEKFVHDRNVVDDFVKICDDARSCLFNRLVVLIARYFGKIPRDVKDFRFTLSQRKVNSRVHIFSLIPLEYLATLVILKNQSIFKQKRVFFISPEQDLIEYALLQRAHSTFYYVHSWDHLWKLNYSSKILYLVWNTTIKNELVQLYPNVKTRIIGNSLMSYLEQNKTRRKKKNARQIIGWPMSYGSHDVYLEEIELVKTLSDMVENRMVIWLREYPRSQILDESLLEMKNVYIHRGSKLEFLEGLDLCFHVGTTLGIEADILGIPSIYLKVDEKFTELYNASKQPHHKFFKTQALLSKITSTLTHKHEGCESSWGELNPTAIIEATKKAIG